MLTHVGGHMDDVVMGKLLRYGSQPTQRMYAKTWRRFADWARVQGLEHAPASAEVLGGYLRHLVATGLTLATVRAARAAVVTAHRLSGWPLPEGVAVDRSIREAASRGRAPRRKARPLRSQDVEAIRARVRAQARESARAAHRARVDLALVQVMREALLRPSEAAALTWGDVEVEPGGGAKLRVRRAGSGWAEDTVSLSCAAAEDLKAIRLGWQCPEDLLFRIPTYAIGRRIRRAASDAGVGDAYTGDSPREGGLEDLVADGVDLREIMAKAGWRTMGRHTLRVQALSELAAARA